MKRYFRPLFTILVAVLSIGSFATAVTAAEVGHRMGKTETITGKVTKYGGLISTQGTSYLLYGSKATGLRAYTNKKVEVTGVETAKKGNRIITVASYKAAGPSHITMRSEQTPKSQQVLKPEVSTKPATEPAK